MGSVQCGLGGSRKQVELITCIFTTLYTYEDCKIFVLYCLQLNADSIEMLVAALLFKIQNLYLKTWQKPVSYK